MRGCEIRCVPAGQRGGAQFDHNPLSCSLSLVDQPFTRLAEVSVCLIMSAALAIVPAAPCADSSGPLCLHSRDPELGAQFSNQHTLVKKSLEILQASSSCRSGYIGGPKMLA